MTKKTYNSVEDFLSDSSFVNWANNSQLSDVSFWDFWLKNNPLKKEMAYEARDILLGISLKKDFISQEKVDEEWVKLESTLLALKKNKTKPSIFDNKISKTIAVASLLILCSFVSFKIYKNTFYITHETAYGEILNLKLKDGTLVTLNANSNLSYKKNNPRKVWIEGEAYFKVNKKETQNAKFLVQTNDLLVEVFGTTFNVNTLREKTKVYLETGNIWLTMDNGISKKMAPREYIEYSSKDQKILVTQKLMSGAAQVSWKNGKLIFKNLPLEKALNKVSDTYGVTFNFKDKSIKNIPITGIVPTTNLNICLNAIKKSTNVNIKKENTKLVVYRD